jgi:type I restriction enzyme S subunit
MEVKPGYKQTEVGVIPEDWHIKQVGKVCDFIVPGRNKPRHFNGEIPWVTTPDIEDGRSVFGSRIGLCITRAEATAIGSKIVPIGSVLMSCAGEVGITAITRKEIVINQQLHAFIPSPEVNATYLLSVIASQKQQIDSLATKTAVPYLNKNNCNSLQIPIPSIVEQEAIAGALSDADALVESLEQLVAKKRQIKHGAMQELLTGQKRLPGFTGEWETKRLGDVADTDPENLGSDTRPSYAFNYIALEDVDSGTLQSYSEQIFQSAPSRARRKLQSYDVLVSTVRPNLLSHLLFKADRGNWVCSTGFCVVRSRPGVTHPYFVFSHLFADGVKRQIEALLTGSNYPAINRGDVSTLLIPLPTFAEQTAIAAILSDMDAEIAALEAKLAKARRVKQGMMQELLTGRIRLV